MAENTVEAVALMDGVGYRYAVEGTDPTEYATGLIPKGDTQEITQREFDRLEKLGAVAKAGTKKAKASAAEAEAEAPLGPAGVTPAEPSNEDEAVIQSAAGPADETTPTTREELKDLTVPQLKALADARGVKYGTRDTKPKLVKKLADAAAAS